MLRFVKTRTKSRCGTRQRRCPLRLEVLEDRTLPSAMLVKDINPGAADSNPRYLSDINHTLFFGADDVVHGRELWKSDGTAAGTQLVKDIVPGAGESDPSGGAGLVGQPMTDVGGTAYFLASDAAGVRGLYRSGGTADTTTLVRAFPGVAAPSWMTAFQGKLYFVGSDTSHPNSLWVSDGTTAGTMPLKITSGTGDLVVADNQLFFAAVDGTRGSELWVSDGTAAGTRALTNLSAFAVPGDLTAFQNKLYFTASTDVNRQLYVSDGTEAGTRPITSFTEHNNPINFLTVVKNSLYFTVQLSSAPGTGWILYKSDGTAAGTTRVAALDVPQDLTAVNDRLFFTDFAPSFDRSLWTSDGTAAGTHLVKGWPSGPAEGSPDHLIAFNNKLYFTAKDKPDLTGKLQLWFSDGTEAGTAIEPIASTFFAGPSPDNLAVSNGNLFFSANDGTHGNELWVLQGPTQQGNGPTISINNVTVKDGDNAVFTVTLSAASSLPVSVQYFTSYDTALVTGDYDPIAPTVLTFAPGETSKTITVSTHKRLQFYDQGTFFVRLRNPVNASLGGSAVGMGTIVHDTKIDTTIPSDLELLVRELYIDLLGRVADPGGLSYWLGLLRGGASKEAVVSGIAGSTERFSYEVRQAYQRFLQRPAEAAGLAFWTSVREGGASLQAMQAGILASEEYFAGRGGSTVPSYLTAVYSDTLSRGLDSVGEAFWSGLLTGGRSRQEVAQAILESKEAAGLLVASDYFQFVHHAPDAAGLAYWLGRLLPDSPGGSPTTSAATRDFPIGVSPGPSDRPLFDMIEEALREALVTSTEYSRVLFSATLLNTWWLQKLYPDLLGRPLDDLGLTVWLSELASGKSRDQVVGEIETEPTRQEARKHKIDLLYHSILGRPDTTPTSAAEISDGLSRITTNDYDPVRAHIYGLAEFSPYATTGTSVDVDRSNRDWGVRLVNALYAAGAATYDDLSPFYRAVVGIFVGGSQTREQFALSNLSDGFFTYVLPGGGPPAEMLGIPRQLYVQNYFYYLNNHATPPNPQEPVFDFLPGYLTPQSNLPDPTNGGKPVYFGSLPGIVFSTAEANYTDSLVSISPGTGLPPHDPPAVRLSEEQLLANILGLDEYMQRPGRS
jgi:ELWxxDGT repeat protein